MLKKSTLMILVTLLAITGCGGSDSDSDTRIDTDTEDEVTTAIGQFKDSNIVGIRYVSGGQSGITGINGTFTYEVGEKVMFSLGGVTVGESLGKSVVTPIDLVSEGSSDSVEVQNIVRLLMMLDEDDDPSNGITISPAILNMADDWTQVDFSTSDLPSELVSIISDTVSSGGMHRLPSLDEAKAHLEDTLLCSYAGAYKGTFSGDDNGRFGILIDVSSGGVKGVAYSVPGDQFIGLSGQAPITYDQNVSFVSGNTTSGATFTGNFTSVNGVAGSWENSLFSTVGTFSGERIGGVVDAKYRFTGNYTGDNQGLLSFDINNSNSLTGVAYNIGFDTLLTVSGTVVGTTLEATVSDGTVITGVLDIATGDFSGNWSAAAVNLSGSFSGGGCRLN